jgi:bacteriorhodopsin
VGATATPQLHDRSALSSYVVVRVAVLVVVVLAAAVVPLMMWRSAPEQTSLVWLAVPVAVAAIAAFATSAQINKRFADALAAERNRS